MFGSIVVTLYPSVEYHAIANAALHLEKSSGKFRPVMTAKFGLVSLPAMLSDFWNHQAG